MRRLDCPIDDLEQFGPHRFKVDGVPQPGRESGNCRHRVVAGAVEAAIDDALNANPERIEEGNRRQRRGSDGDR